MNGIFSLLWLCKFLDNSPLLSMEDTFQDPQKMPETMVVPNLINMPQHYFEFFLFLKKIKKENMHMYFLGDVP